MRKISLLTNKILHLFEIRKINSNKKVVYLTFDDGPEPGITEFVLEKLSEYNFHATFFLRGDFAEQFPHNVAEIRKRGHAIGNHTFSHINGLETPSAEYVDDVYKANDLLNTVLFRPPWGSMSLRSYWKLAVRGNYKIIYWSLSSFDYMLDDFNLQTSINHLKEKTRNGDIVLFHSCKKHERETTQLLPLYLEWLSNNGYVSKKI